MDSDSAHQVVLRVASSLSLLRLKRPVKRCNFPSCY